MRLEFRQPNSKCARPASGGRTALWFELELSNQSAGYTSACAASYISHAESVGVGAEEIKRP